MSDEVIRVGVSSCLLGNKVRFDAGHKREAFVTDQLAAFFELIPVCPEAEVGMGIPREAVRLVGDVAAPRLVGNKTGEDWTERMTAFNAARLIKLEKHRLAGFVLKKGSPTCGMERVRVYNPGGMPAYNGRGLFARALIDRFPDLPVEEEGRLNDPPLRESFIVRVFAYHRLQRLFARRWQSGEVVAFHAAHKLLLLAHSPAHYQALGRLVARVKQVPPAEFGAQYTAGMMAGLRERATTRKHTNVLQHVLGFFRQHLAAEDRAALREVIDDYRKGLVPLVAPVTLLGHYVRKLKIAYLMDQVYLSPHPKELMLRNHV